MPTIDTDDYLQVKDAVPYLRKLGVKRSEMWLKLQVMYDQVKSLEVFSSRVIHKDELAKLAREYKETPIRKARIAAAAILFLISFAPQLIAGEFFPAHYADAIYKVEGGARAVKPYGILSVQCFSEKSCREVCLRTVKNNHARWERAGKPGAFIDFLADRYCPPGIDPQGNKNWKENMREILK